MNVKRWLGVVLVVLIAVSCVYAQNAVDNKVDLRLDKKVSIEMTHTKLEDVCKQLTEQTGVTIKAGTAERDWKVRERKVTIHAKDVPLGSTVSEISRLLGFYVSKSGKEGEWAYTFWQDLKGRQLESEMLSAETENVAQRSVAMRQGALDTAASALALSPEEALKKRATDPWTAYLGGTKGGRAYAQLLNYLATSFPVERDLMLRGKQTSIPLDNVPPHLQQALEDIKMTGYMALARGEITPDQEAMFRGLSAGRLTIMPMSGFGGEGDMAAAGFGGMVSISSNLPDGTEDAQFDGMFGGGIPLAMFPLARTGSLMGKLSGKMLFAVEDGADEDEMQKVIQDEIGNPELFAETLARESPIEKEPPTDPQLTKEVELGELPKFDLEQVAIGSAESIGKEVTAISKALGKPVLLESFTGSMPLGIFLKPGKQPVYKIVIGLEKAGYLWTFDDGMLRLRPDDWALQRSYEIPESTIARYRDILKKNGAFSLDDLANMVGELTDNQISNTLMETPEFTFALMGLQSGFGQGNRELLRLYDGLSSQQKTMLSSEGGLEFSQLSGQQWERLSTIISDQLGGLYIVDGSIRLQVPETDNSVRTHEFLVTVQVGGEEQPRTFTKLVMIYGKEAVAEMQKNVEDAKNKAKEKDAAGTETPPDASTK